MWIVVGSDILQRKKWEKLRIRKFKVGGKKEEIHARGIMISRFCKVSFLHYIFIRFPVGLCCWVRAFSSFGEGGLLSVVVQRLLIAASLVVGYRPLGTQASVVVTQALLLWGMCDLPGQGTEAVSPALTGGKPSTVSPGKYSYLFICSPFVLTC